MGQTIDVNIDKNTMKQAVNIIKAVFYEYHEQLKHRTPMHQNVIGDVLTTLEMDLKQKFNEASKTGAFQCDIDLVYKLENMDRELEQSIENMVPKP